MDAMMMRKYGPVIASTSGGWRNIARFREMAYETANSSSPSTVAIYIPWRQLALPAASLPEPAALAVKTETAVSTPMPNTKGT